MKINPKIKEIFDNHNINYELGLAYLLMLYHSLNEVIVNVPEEVYKQVQVTKIVERDYSTSPISLKWNVALYEGPAIDGYVEAMVAQKDAWSWLTDFRNLFGELRSDAIGSKAAVEKKMKKFFADNPDVRKEDVMRAANLYLEGFRMGRQNKKYLQQADYFISKAVAGDGPSSRLEKYLEVIKNKEVEDKPLDDKHMGQIIK